MVDMEKKTPMRTCCACGESKPKVELIRFVRSSDGVVELDASGKSAGRGTYLCADRKCFEKARKQHRLDKALKISIGMAEYDDLARAFEDVLK